MREFKVNGKLLITSEYMVLKGAKALAVPTQLGQSFSIYPIKTPTISWKSYDQTGAIWINELIGISEIINFNGVVDEKQPSSRLLQVLHQAHQLNPSFLNQNRGYMIESTLEFPKSWGLGTSSTFLSFVADWFQVDAYELLKNTFGGSGYDIACAKAMQPLIYTLQNGHPKVEYVSFNPTFLDNIYFLYLNKKQNSRESIKRFSDYGKQLTDKDIAFFSELTEKVVATKHLSDFENLIKQHEERIGKIIEIEPIQQQLFSDFEGTIKSLGGWGGDFVMVVSKENPSAYFQSKGYDVLFKWKDLILS